MPTPVSTHRTAAASGVAAGSARWRLVELDADGAAGARHLIAGDVTEMGRRGRDIAATDDEQMADHHASLVFESGEWFVVDSGAGSGVWLRIAGPAGWPLESGDQIWLGRQILMAKKAGDAWTLAHYGGDGRLRGTLAIGEDELVIGRGSGHDFASDDSLLSRRHARFVVRDGKLEVVDLGARNGTYVKVSGAAVLANGSEFRIATRRYRFEFVGE